MLFHFKLDPDPELKFRIRIRIQAKVPDPYRSGSGSGSGSNTLPASSVVEPVPEQPFLAGSGAVKKRGSYSSNSRSSNDPMFRAGAGADPK